MTSRPGRQAILEQLVADGFTHMFGNPGTVEQGFLDALAGFPQIKYVLALQESVAVLMGDGYARATGKPALVQLHSSPGLGNAIGALYQAKRGHSPLVVIAGDAGVKYLPMDAQMAADLVAMAAPVTKYATMITDPASVLRVLRRAIKVAITPPMGPVYVCLPQDVLDAACDEAVVPTSAPVSRVVPDAGDIATMAAGLAGATTPLILAGNGVAASGAQAELARLAELLGAEVWEADNGEWLMPHDHPLFQGATGHMFGGASLPVLQRADAVLVVGTYVLPEVYPELGPVFRDDVPVYHIDLDAWEIAKNHPVTLGVLADPKRSLAALATRLETIMGPEERQGAARRTQRLGTAKAARLAAERAQDEAAAGQMPLRFATFMRALAKALPEDAIIFDEALTSSPPIARWRPARQPGLHYQTRGGSLGVGIPGAMGIALAHPERVVVGFTGDGGCMYTVQALWSAVRHGIKAKFVVCNNGAYRLLQNNIGTWWQEQDIAPHTFPQCFDLSSPPLRFDEMARSMGVPALRIDSPDEVEAAVRDMLAYDGPFLLDVVVARPESPVAK
jgi:benzoylformate decarboxylase